MSVTESESGAITTVIDLLPAEYYQNGKLYSPYHHLNLTGVRPDTVVLDAGKSVARAIFKNIPLVNTSLYITQYGVIDNAGIFTPGTNGNYGNDVPYCTLYDNGDGSTLLQLTFPYASITAAGYQPTVEGTKDYYVSKFNDVRLSYRTTDISERTLSLIANIIPGKITVTVNDKLAIDADVLYFNGLQQNHTGNAVARYGADYKNTSTLDFTNSVVELKTTLPPGVVKNHSGLRVTDIDGVEFASQFADDFFVNLRKQSNVGFHADGSFKTGSIFIIDSAKPGDVRAYNIDIYSETYADSGFYPELVRYSSGEYRLTVSGITWRFNKTNANFGLWQALGSDLNEDNGVFTKSAVRGTYVKDGAFVNFTFTKDPSLRLVNTGPVFTEVEHIIFNATVDGVLDAATIKCTTRYRFFTNGQVQIRSYFTALTEIPVGVLSSLWAQMEIASGDGAQISNSHGAAILGYHSMNNGIWSMAQLIANGDIHRDGDRAGPLRPVWVEFGTPTSGYTRSSLGWKIPSPTDYSLLNWPIKSGWTWSSEAWINTNESSVNAETTAVSGHNRPVGFAGEIILPHYALRKTMNRLEQLLDGFVDFWLNGDAVNIGGPSSPNGVTSSLYPQSWLVYQAAIGKKTLSSVMDAFKGFVNKNFGGIENLGENYKNGKYSLAEASPRMFKPLEYLYRLAEEKNETDIVNELKLYISDAATAIANRCNLLGWIPLVGTQSGPSATNANVFGMHVLSLGIYANVDPDLIIKSAFDTAHSFIVRPVIMKYLPVVSDSRSAPLAGNHWVNYEAEFSAVYASVCRLLKIQPSFDNTNYLISALAGDGRIRNIDFNISESRRGIISSPIMLAAYLMFDKRVSTVNALSAALDAYERDWFASSSNRAFRFYDHETALLNDLYPKISSHHALVINKASEVLMHKLIN